MNEQEWLTCINPMAMLEFVRGKASNRKLRLFAIAGCRSMGPFFGENKVALETADRYIDGVATTEQLSTARLAIGKPIGEDIISHAVLLALGENAWEAARGVANEAALYAEASTEILLECQGEDWCKNSGIGTPEDERVKQEAKLANLLRDVIGNPFRFITIDPRWQTSVVVDLAKAIENERSIDRMGILADALMDAGCDSENISAHCRADGPHVRGCWVVDLLLAKE